MARVIEDMRHEGVEVRGMTAHLVAMGHGDRTVLSSHGETVVYVVSGDGAAGDEPLEPESVVFLGPGEHVELEAGAHGLELLVGASA